MALEVEIDRNSGFCGGVIRAIGSAEKYLSSNPGTKLYSLGAIVHNESELERLGGHGLVTIDLEDLGQMDSAPGETLIIRAHGEPPSTYVKAHQVGFRIIDCTCPVVLKLQQSIKETYDHLKSYDPDGQIIIFGKIGHAEVLGLVGQVNGDALVVENSEMLSKYYDQGLIHTYSRIEIFSQTTMSPAEYDQICKSLRSLMDKKSHLTVHDTICRQVAGRHDKLAKFARKHDVIVFVSGKSSSNGKVLCDLCKSVNIRTYRVNSVSEIKSEWFSRNDKVGICGATSTPKWLLEDIANYITGL